MTTFKSRITWLRTRAWWLAVAALPLILAACHNSGSGSGY
jgi:predicted small secreted protein